MAYWEAERDYNQRGWKGEIRNSRIQIKELLKDSPSLKPYLAEVRDECYENARKIIIDITGLASETLPENSITALDRVLDENWFPVGGMLDTEPDS